MTTSNHNMQNSAIASQTTAGGKENDSGDKDIPYHDSTCHNRILNRNLSGEF
jgi:hypothetical protein